MAAVLDWDWLFFAAGGLLGVAALWLLWRGLLADRSKGRARCPRCWYDLAALLPLPSGEGRGEGASRGKFASVTCPECGRVVKRERQLHRTRRRWWAVMFGIMAAALAAAALLTPKVRRDGVWAAMPIWMLVTIDQSVLSGADRPAGLAGEIEKRLLQSETPDWAIRRLVLGRHCRLQFRAKWPEKVPLLGRFVQARTPWEVGIRDLGEPTARIIGIRSLGTDRSQPILYSYELGWEDNCVTFGMRGRLTQLVATFARRDAGSGRWDEREVAVPLPVTFVPQVDDAISPVRGGAINTLIREGLELRLARMPTSERVFLSARSIDATELQGVVIAPQIEIRDGLDVVGRAAWWQTPGRDSHMNGLPLLVDGAATRLEALLRDPTNPRYTVRVRGDGEMALRDFDGTRYWAGEFTMPLSELIRSSQHEK